MNKITLFLLSGVLIFGAAACDGTAKTSSDAPRTVDGEVENPRNVEETREDAASEIRQNQLNSDIRAREQRNDLIGDQTDRADSDLESEVRSKLEANIPRGKLTIDAEDGVVTIAGTVPDQREYKTVEPLAKEILGVKEVKMDNVRVVKPIKSE
ncbi:BON domain-containing protein [Mastigocoleus sp. MO_188.B34]|uniref:BON domain-containing protein n=1 Tax=Mastigocoleus sp. MO_188.B34 TaxID=3036635 RepID=UPI00262EEE18|nr:BON domain-containing protein [Mastigocoleus sp. MO_188.B34]MDJ0694607.1 BON domain-containing protein [Mastigocoleus sp. MO_188.B34]